MVPLVYPMKVYDFQGTPPIRCQIWILITLFLAPSLSAMSLYVCTTFVRPVTYRHHKQIRLGRTNGTRRLPPSGRLVRLVWRDGM